MRETLGKKEMDLLREPLRFSQVWGLNLVSEWKSHVLKEHTLWCLVFLYILQSKALVAFYCGLSLQRCLYSKQSWKCFPPEQRAYLLTIYYKIFRFTKSTGTHSVCSHTLRLIYMTPVEVAARRTDRIILTCVHAVFCA